MVLQELNQTSKEHTTDGKYHIQNMNNMAVGLKIFINRTLEEKLFFADIKREGKVLYNLSNFEFSDSKELTPTSSRNVLHSHRKGVYPLQPLRTRILKFYCQINEVLPCKTKEQGELFDYLNYACIDGHYRSEEEFSVKKS